jgi:hypothetical protein
MANSNGQQDVQVKNIKMGALWKNSTQDGREYFSGKIEMDISVWPNGFKVDGDKKPDLLVQHRPPKPKEAQAVGGFQQQGQQGFAGQQFPGQNGQQKRVPYNQDDTPF